MFFIRSFEAMYQFVNEAIATLTVYIDAAILAVNNTITEAIADLTTYIDDEIDAIPPSLKWYDAGDIETHSFRQEYFSLNGAWHDLDLSSIIPEGTKQVRLSITFKADSVGRSVYFRKSGNTEYINVATICEYYAKALHYFQIDVFCSDDLQIAYKGYSDIIITQLDVDVIAWYK